MTAMIFGYPIYFALSFRLLQSCRGERVELILIIDY
jgi:hypothetical protein